MLGELDAVTVVTFWVFWVAILVLLLLFLLLEILGYWPSSWFLGMFGDDICSDLCIALPGSLACIAACLNAVISEKKGTTILLSLSLL